MPLEKRLAVAWCVWIFIDAHGLQEGSVHKMKVTRLMDYGAAVNFPNGSSSLLRMSQISHTRVQPQCKLVIVGFLCSISVL